eukprot:SAG22_NODE_5500_length_1003_cov_1.688053_2_plen_79_part_00
MSSVLPGGGAASLGPEQQAALERTIADFTREIMAADKNQDGKLSREEFVSWITDPATSLADEKLMTKWMDMFSSTLAL